MMGFLTAQAAGELEVLRTFALQQLAQMRTTVHGLSDEQSKATPSPSELDLSSLLRHAGFVAVLWSGMAASAPERPQLPQEDFDFHGSLEEILDVEMPLAEALRISTAASRSPRKICRRSRI